jgi:hypothetical protein
MVKIPNFLTLQRPPTLPAASPIEAIGPEHSVKLGSFWQKGTFQSSEVSRCPPPLGLGEALVAVQPRQAAQLLRVARPDGGSTSYRLQTKTAPVRRRRSDSERDLGDQAVTRAWFLGDRRYIMKPIPRKPRIIMAQVEGSGTAVTTGVPIEKTPLDTKSEC